MILVSLKLHIAKMSTTNTNVLLTMVSNRTAFILCCKCTHFIGTLHIPIFVNTYLIFFSASKPFLALFPLSGGPSPLHHLADSSSVHLKCYLPYEPLQGPQWILSTLSPTSHSKQLVAPSSAHLAPCTDLIITPCCNCWLSPPLNREHLGVFSPQVYQPT